MLIRILGRCGDEASRPSSFVLKHDRLLAGSATWLFEWFVDESSAELASALPGPAIYAMRLTVV